MSNIIDKILVSGVTYDLPSGGSGSTTVELTQAEYDALVSGGTVDPDTYYIITDATPQDMSQYWTSAQTNSAITKAVSGKQDTLIAGDNITISGNVISASGGGGSITIDPSLDSGSTNAVANSAITVALNAKQNTSDAAKAITWDNSINPRKNIQLRLQNVKWGTIIDSADLGLGNNLYYQGTSISVSGVVETSAITSSVTSASTDSQVPSAKAVYDALQEGSGGITSGEVQSMIDESISGKADTSAVTESIDAAVSGKVDTTTFEIYSGNVETSLSGKQDTLSAGTNITITDNVISAQLEGGTVSRGDVEDMIEEATSGLQETLSAGTGIEIDSANTISCTVSGKTYSAGTNISIDANDAINCTLPISAYTASSYHVSLTVFGKHNTISNTKSDANFIVGNHNNLGSAFDYSSNNYIFGSYNYLNKGYSNIQSNNNFVVGNNNNLGKNFGEAVSNCKIFGMYLNPKNNNEIVFGRYNNSVSDGTTSGNTLFSVGNGTADDARHNAFEIKQNGDIYITSGGTDIKLQDNLGGGGASYSAGTNIDITDNVISVSGVVETSAITTSVTSGSTDSEVPSAKAVYDQLGGMKIVKLTESEYTALVTKDSNTLYVVIPDPSN